MHSRTSPPVPRGPFVSVKQPSNGPVVLSSIINTFAEQAGRTQTVYLVIAHSLRNCLHRHPRHPADHSLQTATMAAMLGGGDGMPLEQWFFEMPVCTRWWTTATVLCGVLVQCHILTPFQLFYSFRAVFHKQQVSEHETHQPDPPGRSIYSEKRIRI